METMYIQSTKTGRIYCVLKTAGESQLKSGQYIRVPEERAQRISASMAGGRQ